MEASVLGCRMVVVSKEERLGYDDKGREEAKQVFVQRQEDEEYLIVRFQSQIGLGGRFVSGVALLVWKNGETIMVAVEDRGQKVRKRRMKDQN